MMNSYLLLRDISSKKLLTKKIANIVNGKMSIPYCLKIKKHKIMLFYYC